MKTRGAVLRQAPGKFEITDLIVDEPRQNEIRVKMVASGLCHSDDHMATATSRSPSTRSAVAMKVRASSNQWVPTLLDFPPVTRSSSLSSRRAVSVGGAHRDIRTCVISAQRARRLTMGRPHQFPLATGGRYAGRAGTGNIDVFRIHNGGC